MKDLAGKPVASSAGHLVQPIGNAAVKNFAPDADPHPADQLWVNGFAKPNLFVHHRAQTLGDLVPQDIVKRHGGEIDVESYAAFAAGQALSEHSAPFDAIVQILDGNAELVIAGDKVAAAAGQTVMMPANIPHAVNAVERFKMLLVMVREVSK